MKCSKNKLKKIQLIEIENAKDLKQLQDLKVTIPRKKR